ncbi:hypothetical protein SprV_0301382900 [Sparganum proliferum]
MTNIVIGGGSGFVGRALISKLRAHNFNVRIVSRKPTEKKDLSWKTVTACGLPEDTQVVVNLSGRSIAEINPRFLIPSVYQDYLEEVRSSRIKTTKLLANNLPKATRKFINASAIGFYKPDLSKTYTEDSPYQDYDFVTRLCRDWEAAAFVPNSQTVHSLRVRIGVVLARNSAFLNSLYTSHRMGLGGPIGSGQQWLSWIHLADLVDLFYFLITQPTVAGSDVFNGTAPNPVRQAAFSRALSQSLGAPLAGRVRTPALAMRLLLGGTRATLALEGQRVLPARALSQGFRFRFPTLESALEDIYGRRPSPVPTN